MALLVVDNGTSYLGALKDITAPFNPMIVSWNDLKHVSTRDYEGIILSGGHTFAIATDPNEFEQEMELVKSTPIPILGICLGYELIGYTFGAKLEKLPRKEHKIISITILEDDPIFNTDTHITVFENHSWMISELSEQLKPLARSVRGFEIIKHVSMPIYGFQFHPEIIVDPQALTIFDNWLSFVHGDLK
ncbi:C26 family cysteine hydrolase domain-containing family [candidate division WWE3 bacterium]|nr:C26 family cysteine hydrolase domain-containing family [candidate division WWE3 bacterium]